MDGNYIDAGPGFINSTNPGSKATTNYVLVANITMAYSNPALQKLPFFKPGKTVF
jgi:hypothetical protein